MTPQPMSNEKNPLYVDQLGKYFLIAELARGGMGIVYLAVARGPGGFSKLCVIKELKSEDPPTQAQVRAFLDEARLAARLNHGNIVQTNEVASDGDRHYMVMEHLDGQPLARLNKRFRRDEMTPPLDLAYIVVEALVGLHAAHELEGIDGKPLNLVHRDVSPQNIFITYDGQVKVMDFGIAKTSESTHKTKTGVLKGKVAFMAPEQVRTLPTDRRADIFAMGLVLFEAIAGKRIWALKNDVEVIASLVAGGAPDPADVEPSFPEPLAAIVRKATGPLQTRYATALEMQEDLERTLAMMNVPPYNPRDFGKRLSAMFETDRKRIKTIVDAQLQRLTSTRNPTLMIPMLQFSQRPPSDLTPSQIREQADSSIGLDDALRRSSSIPSLSMQSLSQSIAPTGTGSHSGQTKSGAEANRTPMIMAGAALLIALGGAGALWLRGTNTPQASVNQTVSVVTEPAGARVLVDGKLVGETPLREALPVGTHVIVLQRAGYENEELTISLVPSDELKSVRLSLRKNDNAPALQGLPLVTESSTVVPAAPLSGTPRPLAFHPPITPATKAGTATATSPASAVESAPLPQRPTVLPTEPKIKPLE